MLQMFKKQKKTDFDEAIKSIFIEMKKHDKFSEEYFKLMGYLERLNDMRNESESRKVKPDTIWIGAMNLIAIFAVLNHERIDIITSKAFGLIGKWRV